jgi:hypothetical protein
MRRSYDLVVLTVGALTFCACRGEVALGGSAGDDGIEPDATAGHPSSTGSPASTSSSGFSGSPSSSGRFAARDASVASTTDTEATDAATDGGSVAPMDPSFAKDVMPILQQSCTISSVCHGQMGNSGEENLYLGQHQTSLDGTPVDPAVAMMVNTGIVSKPSLEDPSMDAITPGSLANSYLWHKLQGDQDMLEAQCAKGMCNSASCQAPTTCGVQMPMAAGQALPDDQLAVISNWITAGAKNN